MVFAKLERTSSNSSMIEILARFLPKLSPQQIRISRIPAFRESRAELFGTGIWYGGEAGYPCGVTGFRCSARSHYEMAVKSGDMGAVAEQFGRNACARVYRSRMFSTSSRKSRTRRVPERKSLKSASSRRFCNERRLRRPNTSSGRSWAFIGLEWQRRHFYGACQRHLAGRRQETIDLDRAYNVLSDLGEVAFRAAHSGLRSLKRVEPKAGSAYQNDARDAR